MGKSVDCLHYEPQLGVLLVSGLERLVPCDERIITGLFTLFRLTLALWAGIILRSVTTFKSPLPELFQPRITEMKNKHD